MADSSQKILKEFSDLIRNLDVLAKEIRAMNKNTASVQDAVVKSVEKKESPENKQGNKESTTSVNKTVTDSKKVQEEMFSKFIETLEKNSKIGNEQIKKVGLEAIKSSGKELIKTESLKEAGKSGLSSIVKSGKNSIVDQIKKKNPVLGEVSDIGLSYLAGKIPEALKKKEKAKKEEATPGSSTVKESFKEEVKESEKKEKKSILEKLNIKKKSKEEKIEAAREKTTEEKTEDLNKKTSEEKVEKKGLLSKLREKILSKESQKEDLALNERIDQKDSPTPEAQEKKDLPSLKSITTGASPVSESIEKNSSKDKPKEGLKDKAKEGLKDKAKEGLKDKAKQIFEKTTLGATIKKFSDERGKKKSEDPSATSSVQNQPEELSVGSKIEKVETELKSKFKSKKKESQDKEKTETPPDKEPKNTITSETKSSEIKSMEKSGSKEESKKKESDKDKGSEISAQDIADIKSLLASINSTLNSPLNIKDNKPYRPQSNMLNEF